MKNLKVGKSKIQGKGLFTTQPFTKGSFIGLAHEDDQPSTMIGKYHNHSESPNAMSVKVGGKRYLVAKRPLKNNEEITTDYRLQPELEQTDQFKRGGIAKLPKMPKPSKKGVLAKGYSRSIEATNRFFTENKLFEKPKSRKNRVFDPNANYEDGGSLPQAEYGMPMGAGMSQNYQGRRKFIYDDGGETDCPPGLRKDEFGNCIPITTNKEVVVKTPKANPITKKLNYLRKKLEKYDSQNDGLGPTKMSDMSERGKIYEQIVELEAKHKDKLKNTPRIDQMEAVGNTMLTAGKYFMPVAVRTGINYLLNASDAYDYAQDPNDESNKLSVASDMLSPLKSSKTKVAPFSVMSDVINLKQQYDKFEGAKKKKYQEGGYIETELTDEEIEEYRKGGWIVEDIY
jgi:hypothetical protein